MGMVQRPEYVPIILSPASAGKLERRQISGHGNSKRITGYIIQ